jgi:hypothetical protein
LFTFILNPYEPRSIKPISLDLLFRPGSPGSTGSYSGALTRSASTGSQTSTGSAASLADPASLENAVNVYNALVAVIRDVVLKAKLTPIGGTEGINYVGKNKLLPYLLLVERL